MKEFAEYDDVNDGRIKVLILLFNQFFLSNYVGWYYQKWIFRKLTKV